MRPPDAEKYLREFIVFVIMIEFKDLCIFMNNINRREFLKLSTLALGSLGVMAFNPFPPSNDDQAYPSGIIGRVTISNQVSVYQEPDWDSPVIGYLNTKDAIIQLYYELTPRKGPPYNPLWYRVWGGYVHSAFIQRVKVRFNQVLKTIPQAGQLCEVTVPYTQTYRYDVYQKVWRPLYKLYYETTHWIIGIETGPDNQPWYRILGGNLVEYLAPAQHFRPIPDEEMAPISPDVPWEAKYIKISLRNQTMTAFENDTIVMHTQVSTGLPIKPVANDIPWETPTGEFYIENKTPSTHMGEGNLTGDPEAYELPGVPWTMYFVMKTGVAFHGAYWHNNFGVQMSHGCVNMRPREARWLYRWCDPRHQLPMRDRSNWRKQGLGTLVIVEKE